MAAVEGQGWAAPLSTWRPPASRLLIHKYVQLLPEPKLFKMLKENQKECSILLLQYAQLKHIL